MQHDNPGSFGDLLWVAGFQRRDDPGLPGNCLFFTFLLVIVAAVIFVQVLMPYVIL